MCGKFEKQAILVELDAENASLSLEDNSKREENKKKYKNAITKHNSKIKKIRREHENKKSNRK